MQIEEQLTPIPREYQELKPNVKTLIYLLKHMKIKVSVQIINKFFKKLDGRDKSNKMIQYALKFILTTMYKTEIAKKSEFYKRASALASTFSLTRKVLRLGHAIETYADFENAIEDYKQIQIMLKTQKNLTGLQKASVYVNYIDIFNAILTIGNDMFDDIYCLSQINVLEKSKWEVIGDFYGTGLWWITIIFDFIVTGFAGIELFVKVNEKRKEINNVKMRDSNILDIEKLEKELENLEYKCIEKFWSCSKFGCDFVFCSFLALETYNFKQQEFGKKYPFIPIIFAFAGGFHSWLKHLRKTQ